jgi:LmbE family N-acetylglucosaminyl deacetylase
MASDKLRIIVFGAHPDDCEYVRAGTGAKWAAKGHAVKFVALHQRRRRPLRDGGRTARPAPLGGARRSAGRSWA